MKKIFFMAVSAVLLAAGCQKTEIQNEALTPIGFNIHMGKLTKAPDAGNAGRYQNLNEQGFMAWGYFNAEDDLNYKQGDLYLGADDGVLGIKVNPARDDHGTILVGDTGAAQSWTTAETYYWPGKDKSLDIYCVSLYDGGDNPTNTYSQVTPSYADESLTVKNFVVDAGADNDLMVAPLITQDQDAKKFVEPQFTHALTKVLVNFKTNSISNEIYVISAKTSLLPNKGTLTVTNTPLSTDETFVKDRLKWDLSSAEEDKYQYNDQFTGKTLVADAITDLPSEYNGNLNAVKLTYEQDGEGNTTFNTIQFASWLLLPQESLTATLDVEYIVDKMYIKQTFNLSTETVTSWPKNTQTTYNVTISPDYIEFAPVVEDWVEDNNNIVDFGE